MSTGLVYGPVEAVISIQQFDTTILQGGSLLHLVLQSDSSHDIKEVLSPMAYSPLLERIKFLAQKSNILGRIAAISQNYRDNSPPLELIFTHQQETTLAKLTLEPTDSLPTTGAPIMPYVDVQEWCLDHIYESMQDSSSRLLDKASQLFPSTLTSFTLNINALQRRASPMTVISSRGPLLSICT